jgi:hypothetical protein
MTEKEIIDMANQVGFECTIHKQFTKANTFVEVGTVVEGDFANLNQFAKLIAEVEREACAKIADEWSVAYPHPSKTIAETILARGKE